MTTILLRDIVPLVLNLCPLFKRAYLDLEKTPWLMKTESVNYQSSL